MDYNATLNLTGSRFHQPIWIIGEVFNLIFWLAVTWAGLALITYGIRTGKWKRENVYSVAHVNAGAVYTTAVLAILMSYVRLLADQCLFNVGYPGSTPGICEVFADMSVTGYGLTMTCVYVFMWFRQRSLYQHPTMSCVDRPWLQYVNWGTLAFITVGGLAGILAYAIPPNYTESSIGCTNQPGDFQVWGIYLGNAVVVVGQILLLVLFFYPLRSNLVGSNAERIKKLIRRSVISASVCVATDLITMALFVFVLPRNGSRQLPAVVYELNMMVNLCSVILSFESWRKILSSEKKPEVRVASTSKDETGQFIL